MKGQEARDEHCEAVDQHLARSEHTLAPLYRDSTSDLIGQTIFHPLPLK